MTVVAPVDYLVLSQEDVVAADGLDMDACIATIEETLVLHHRGETVAPQKSALHWSDDIDTDEKDSAGSWPCPPTWAARSRWPA